MNMSKGSRKLSRIILGSAQFGSDYGVTNSKGMVHSSEIGKIINLARDNGCRLIDTASAYGASEKNIAPHIANEIAVQTKVQALNNDQVFNEISFSEKIAARYTALDTNFISGMAIHDASHLDLHTVMSCKTIFLKHLENGSLRKWGLSLYPDDHLLANLDVIQPDFIQIPLSPFDTRLFRNGGLDKVRALGIEIQVRSIFLQGILLSDPLSVPTYFRQFYDLLNRWDEFFAGDPLKKLSYCVHWLFSLGDEYQLVLGTTSVGELNQVIQIIQDPVHNRNREFAIEDVPLPLIDPRRWHL